MSQVTPPSSSPPAPGRSFPPGAGWLSVLALAVIIVGVSAIQVLPRFGPASQPIAIQGVGPGAGGTGLGTTALPSGVALAPGVVGGAAGQHGSIAKGPGVATGGGAASAQSCNSTNNGGATDTGVTATSISLASTIVNSGVGQSFLGPVQYGMQAVVNRVNRGGGICGRHLNLTVVDDGWDAARGCSDIQSFIHDGAFALPVVPSSEGLKQCIDSGVIHSAGIPVVGSDGMLFDQYQASSKADWVWPVAASTLSTMHIMAIDAYRNHNARTFCLVYDSKYHFGIEGEQAFKAEIGRLGGKLTFEEGLDPDVTDYSGPVNDWNNNCGGVDFAGMLLEPDEAGRWLSDNPTLPKGKGGVAGAQPMFSNSLTANCGDICDGIKVFTGYRPVVDPAYSNLPSVVQYENDVRAESSQADLTNQFLEGGYDGMLLVVQCLKAIGAHLTRAAVKAYLDSTTFAADGNGLTQPLTWRPGNHFANVAMKAYVMVANSGRVTGYRPDSAGFITDPNAGADAPSD